jgi:exodeoxyribonuclease-5
MSAAIHTPSNLLQRRRQLIDRIVDLPSAIAATHVLLRLTEQLPAECHDRLRILGLRDAVREHFARLHAEPEFDQQYACERILELLHAGVSPIALLGPGGSGKTHTLVYEAIPAIRKDLVARGQDPSIQITSPTNLGVNVLRRRGVEAMTNHAALYQLGFGPCVDVVRQWLLDDGIGELPDDVKSSLSAAWRNASPGPRERAQHKAKANLMDGALRELGLAGGLMDVLPPRWLVRDELATPIAVWVVDEASMMTSTTLDDIQARADSVLLVGDPFQLPAILDQHELLRGVTGALAQVPLAQQVHLYTDRRTRGETQHLRAAQAILKDGISVRDIDRWATNGEIPGLQAAHCFNASLMTHAPALCYYRNSVVRLSVEQRRLARLPHDQLVPGERLLIESIARDLRERLTAVEIMKNGRVIVLRQTSPYQATVIAEHVLAQLVAECREQGREPTREEIGKLAVSIPLAVSYPIGDLADAGVAYDEDITGQGALAPVRGQAVNARFGTASTTHKAQGSSFPVIQICADDMAGYSRSQYGNEIAEDIPIPVWRRTLYTALTRAEEKVIWVREGRARAARTVFDGTIDATSLEAALPAALHGISQQGVMDDLESALGKATSTAPLPPVDKTEDRRVIEVEFRTPIEPDEPPCPDVPAELHTWLFSAPGRLPWILPAPDNDQLRFRWERDSYGAADYLHITRQTRWNLTLRVGVIRPSSRMLQPSGQPKAPLTEGVPEITELTGDDLEAVIASMHQLRCHDPSTFVGLRFCGHCGCTLTDAVSQRWGIHPNCASRYGIVLPVETSP